MVKGVRSPRGAFSLSHVAEIALGALVALKVRDVVDSFIDNVFVQLVGGIIDRPTLTSDAVTFGDAQIYLGTFVATCIGLLIYALLILLAVMLYRRRVRQRSTTPHEVESDSPEILLLTEIRDALQAPR